MIYGYTMMVKLVNASAILSFMEGDEIKQIMEIPVEGESPLTEEGKVEDLESKIGEQTPNGEYEFVGYKDLVKVIN